MTLLWKILKAAAMKKKIDLATVHNNYTYNYPATDMAYAL